jgi:hypothetical protein
MLIPEGHWPSDKGINSIASMLLPALDCAKGRYLEKTYLLLQQW